MKAKLEAIANVTVIVMALVVGFLVLRGKFAGPQTEHLVAVGDHISQIAGVDWSRHQKTLVLALNTGCHFCQDSAPFYQKLARAQGPATDDVEIVAVFPNDPEAVQQLMKDEGLAVRSISAIPLEKLGVAGTPTLILVDSQGRVERTWFGLLTPREELEVMGVVSGGSQNSSASEHPAFQVGGNPIIDSGPNEQAKN